MKSKGIDGKLKLSGTWVNSVEKRPYGQVLRP